MLTEDSIDITNMITYRDFFKNKRVTMLGLGLLGRAVGDAEFLAKLGVQLVVTDKKSQDELKESVERLQQYPNVSFVLGEHRAQDFTNTDMVIKAAGVRLDSPEIAAAREAGVPVYMSTALFAKFASEQGTRIVGITGTRGKSTVTHMIYHVLALSGARVHLGGNVRGVSSLAMIPTVSEGDMVVLELDSWQLQGFGDLDMSPNVSVFTNLMSDHQNYYGNMDTYFADKAKIFTHQKEGDTLVAGPSIAERIKEAHPPQGMQVAEALPSDWQLAIPGEHNRENASLARGALQALGLSDSQIKAGLETFVGVEGRLQFVAEKKGVKIYNDNNATTPEATLAALRALGDAKNIILIMGGSDKGLDMSALLYEIAQRCKRVILLPGAGTDRITPLMQDFSLYGTMQDAVRESYQSAEPGDIILFSPAFASFGLFKNEYDRNDQFLAAIKAL